MTETIGRGKLLRRGAVLAWLALTGGVGLAKAATFPPGFQESTIFSGLSQPTAVKFATDGRVFVAEKRGLVKVFDSLTATTPTVFADLRPQVYDFWDRGLLGLELHPNFPTTPHVFVLYTLDKNPANAASPIPTWGDTCPGTPGATTDGCVASARLSRLTGSGDPMVAVSETILLGLLDNGTGDPWCQQFPSHSIGALAFGSDGALYVSSGDGASFNTEDYGQLGGTLPNTTNPLVPRNVCGDPPGGVGGAMSPPTAQGGALRSQSLRRPSGPVLLNGTILRLDPDTGAALPDNPLIAHPDDNAKRIVAYGLRNPYRITTRPGTSEIWIGDVGANFWEEVNRIVSPTSAPPNFGWPCYEGAGPQSGFVNRNLDSCVDLYTAGTAVAPHHAYNHSMGSSSIAGLAFYETGDYPAAYAGGLFFTDYNRKIIFLMPAGGGGVPNAGAVVTFASSLAGGAVDLVRGPGGDIFYVDYSNGRIQRITYGRPSASATANPTFGAVPLLVAFDGSGSTGVGLTYAWDLDGDGQFDDSTAVSPSWNYASPGTYSARLRVTDSQGVESTSAPIVISANNTPPVPTIDSPTSALTWTVGESITFAGGATDPQDGVLAPARLSWRLIMQHCPSNCHEHVIEDFVGVASGSFAAPDHEYPSYLELRLTATDSGGLSTVTSVSIQPKTVDLTFETDPTGLAVSWDLASFPSPFTRTVIVGSTKSVAVAPSQAHGGLTYDFDSWSDGGAPSHSIVAPATAATYRAIFRAYADLAVQQTVSADSPSIGSPVDFRIDVSNSGPNVAPSVVVTDTLPDGATFLSATGDGWSCVLAATVVTCTRPTLAVGAAPPLTVATLAPSDKGTMVNAVAVASNRPDPNAANDSSSLTVPVGLYRFHTVEPCRLVDTRITGPALQAGSDRTFALAGACGIPESARALSLNVTITEASAAGDLRIAPPPGPPSSSVINYVAGQTRAAQAVVALDDAGDVVVRSGQATGSVHLILDVNGYFE